MAPVDVQELALSEDPERYLWRLGFRPPKYMPILTLTVEGHAEVGGHTMYNISCEIHCPPQNEKHSVHQAPRDIVWTHQARLADLREHLHDPVKGVMAERYKDFFGNTPFAAHGGVPGTTGRLNAWMATLASVLNKRSLSSRHKCQILRFLKAPVPESSDQELLDEFGKCEECSKHTGSIRLRACRVCEGIQEETMAMKLIRSIKTVQFGLRVAGEFRAAGERRAAKDCQELSVAGDHPGARGGGDEHPGADELRALGEQWGSDQHRRAEELRAAEEQPRRKIIEEL
eukprot:TRINITY_DN10307_c0_g1_i3.p1 TRINITY_DN10307_c0_g1~~TRINITY_DN10307_c0_g1_i3.p1  ORF type:complete len:299 (+),score=66.22 TRINITY_DN10307_c0_g1_i3:37-897(+)